MKISQFKEDPRAQEGTWEEVGEGLEIKVARMNNSRQRLYVRQKSRAAMAKRARRAVISNATGSDPMEDIQMESVAYCVLLDWRGLEDDNGAKIAFSHEKALELFRSHPDFYDTVVEIAATATVFARDADKDAEGNSSNASRG